MGASTWREQEAGEADDQHVEHDADDDLVDEVGDREEAQHQGDERAGDHRRDQAGPGGAGERADHRRREGAEEQLPVDGDVDDAGPLAQDAAQRAEDEGDGQGDGAGRAARPRARAAGGGPGEEAGHPGDGEEDRQPQTGVLRRGV